MENMKQKLTQLKGEEDKSTIIFGDPLSTIDRIRQKTSNDIEKFNNNSKQKKLIDIYRTLNNCRIHILFKWKYT